LRIIFYVITIFQIYLIIWLILGDAHFVIIDLKESVDYQHINAGIVACHSTISVEIVKNSQEIRVTQRFPEVFQHSLKEAILAGETRFNSKLID